MEPTRESALALLLEFSDDDQAMQHALSVESAMRHIARAKGEDEEKWAIVGLIRCLDLKGGTERGPGKPGEVLRQRGWPEEYVDAVLADGWGIGWDAELAQLITDNITGDHPAAADT